MLKGINPILTGEILMLLDQMGHSDTVLISDAHFPAFRLSDVTIDVARPASEIAAAICALIELDDVDAVRLMDSEGTAKPVQIELIEATGITTDKKSEDEKYEDLVADPRVRLIPRFDYYDETEKVSFIIRSTETRKYANIIISKGVTPS